MSKHATMRLPDLDAIDAAVDSGQILSGAIIRNLTGIIRKLAGLPQAQSREDIEGQLRLFEEESMS